MDFSAIHRFKAPPSTSQLNKPFSELFTKGVIGQATVTPFGANRGVQIDPFSALSEDGMLVTGTNVEIQNLPESASTTVVLRAQYSASGAPTMEIVQIPTAALAIQADRAYLIVLCTVVTTAAPNVLEADIDVSVQESIDTSGRSQFRGSVANFASLPDPTQPTNQTGDVYYVADNNSLAAWDGDSWGSLSVSDNTLVHRQMLAANLPGGSDRIQLPSPVYVGTGDVTAALELFRVTDDSGSYGIMVNGVLVAPTDLVDRGTGLPINPAVDANAEGFIATNIDLVFAPALGAATGVIAHYGQETSLGTLPKEVLLRAALDATIERGVATLQGAYAGGATDSGREISIDGQPLKINYDVAADDPGLGRVGLMLEGTEASAAAGFVNIFAGESLGTPRIGELVLTEYVTTASLQFQEQLTTTNGVSWSLTRPGASFLHTEMPLITYVYVINTVDTVQAGWYIMNQTGSTIRLGLHGGGAAFASNGTNIDVRFYCTVREVGARGNTLAQQQTGQPALTVAHRMSSTTGETEVFRLTSNAGITTALSMTDRGSIDARGQVRVRGFGDFPSPAFLDVGVESGAPDGTRLYDLIRTESTFSDDSKQEGWTVDRHGVPRSMAQSKEWIGTVDTDNRTMVSGTDPDDMIEVGICSGQVFCRFPEMGSGTNTAVVAAVGSGIAANEAGRETGVEVIVPANEGKFMLHTGILGTWDKRGLVVVEILWTGQSTMDDFASAGVHFVTYTPGDATTNPTTGNPLVSSECYHVMRRPGESEYEAGRSGNIFGNPTNLLAPSPSVPVLITPYQHLIRIEMIGTRWAHNNVAHIRFFMNGQLIPGNVPNLAGTDDPFVAAVAVDHDNAGTSRIGFASVRTYFSKKY